MSFEKWRLFFIKGCMTWIQIQSRITDKYQPFQTAQLIWSPNMHSLGQQEQYLKLSFPQWWPFLNKLLQLEENIMVCKGIEINSTTRIANGDQANLLLASNQNAKVSTFILLPNDKSYLFRICCLCSRIELWHIAIHK